MEKLFQRIVQEGVSPDQFYMILCVKNNTAPLLINPHMVSRALIGKGLLTTEGKLTSEADNLINNIDADKPVVTKHQVILDPNIIQAYIEVFPRKMLPSGKFARTSVKNLIPAFRWFVDNYDYSWETIIAATKSYVASYESKNYLYMKTCQYFIRKQQTDKSWVSELADYCESIVSGTEKDPEDFKSKVV